MMDMNPADYQEEVWEKIVKESRNAKSKKKRNSNRENKIKIKPLFLGFRFPADYFFAGYF